MPTSGSMGASSDTGSTGSSGTDGTDPSTSTTTTGNPTTSSDPTTNPTSNTTEDKEPQPCQVETANAEPLPSNILFVLDKSGSMSMEQWDHDGNPMTPTVTRWKSLHEVVDFVVHEFEDTINFGAKLFPKYDAGSYINEGACEVDPGVEVPIAPNNADGVLDGIPGPDYEVLGGTPVYSGAAEAYDYLKDVDPTYTRAVILVADGEISCSESELDAMLEVEDAWLDHDIGTYVVGIDASAETIAQLNLYAEVGGKPNPQGDDILFYQTVNQDDLHQAIQDIVYDTISCVIDVDPIPDQPWLYEVWIDNQLVEEVESCDDGPGWAWTKEDHSELELCESACMNFKITGEFEAKYWCTPE